MLRATLNTLLRHGANIHKLRPRGWYAQHEFHDQESGRMQKMVQLLLDRGADPDPRTSKWALSIMQDAHDYKYDAVTLLMLQACSSREMV